MSNSTENLLYSVKSALLRCWLIGFGLLALTFAASQLARTFVVDLHGWLFGLTGHEIDIIMYCAMGLIKLLVLVCFFIPWLSLHWTLPRQRETA